MENAAYRSLQGVNGTPKSSLNLADEIQTLLTRLTNDDENFVQAVNIQLRRSPAVILFTKDQIDDIRTFCSEETDAELRSVLSFDRTFNLSSLFVTVMVYKNKKVVRRASQEPPIFVGPILLHGDGKYETYLNFFSTVNGALNGTQIGSSEFRILEQVVTGSDEERALVNAARTAFPKTNQLYCMLHCKDNVRHHLITLGCPTSIRESVLSLLFGCNGVAEATNTNDEDDRIAQLMQSVRQNNLCVVDYLETRVLPKIRGNNQLKWAKSWIGQRQWTNNNCESANHILKVL